MEKILLKFKNIGRSKASFESKIENFDGDIEYDFLYNKVKPYILSNNIDFIFDKENENKILIYAGFNNVGEIEIIKIF